MQHEVKILKRFFEDILSGMRTFEIRYNDRNFQVGDTLLLREINRDAEGSYTGRELSVDVTYIYTGDYCKRGYCCMSIKLYDDGWIDAQRNSPPMTDTECHVSDYVLVLRESGRQCVCYYVYADEGNYWCSEDEKSMYDIGEVTHWRPLPKPPKKKG